ncbi:MAG: beta-galactosidase GalB [Saprospiraceae bacterium]
MIFSACTNESNKDIPLRKSKFNANWVFYLGEVEQAINTDFDDADWANVNIPHDWSIEGEIKQDNPSGRQGGFYPGGVGYYRKTFPFENAWKDKQVSITFDGVMSNSEVWINGQSLGKRPNGYVGFTYDLTSFLKDGDNVLVVRADNSAQPNSRWYTGCGIYRNVWLTVKNKIAVVENGTYVLANKVSSEFAEVQIETTIENVSSKVETIQIISEVYNPEGDKLAEKSTTQDLGNDGTKMIEHKVEVQKPSLWSTDTPDQYLLVTKLMSGSELLDQYETSFGIRDIRFEIETGFWLNGENIKVKGVNNHHDGGPVGAAVPDDVLYRRLLMLKDMGCNAIRTAHNPFSPEFYSMCDSLGFLVMDEVFDEWIASWPWVNYQNQGKIKHGYHEHFEEWAETDLKDIILRDRNHPSIFMWSVGNEIPDQCYAEGPERLKPLLEIVHSLDPTRPVTAGCCFMHLANDSGFSSLLDVAGYNGGGGSVFYEKDKAIYPDRKFIATEIPHSFQTRGVYQTKTIMRSPQQGILVPDLTQEEVFPDIPVFYSSSYDNASVRISARDSWRRTDSLNYVAGEFRWTGFDYLGEAIKGWPSRFYNFGIIDLCGFPKDHFYFYQSQWTEQPMVHILPHWTHPTIEEGTIIPVWTYSNAEEVELFLNDQSLGAKSNQGQMNLSWDVPYKAGTLKAVAKTNGEIVSEKIVKTAGTPAKIEILTDKKTIMADGESCAHLEVNVLDADGNFVPYASNLISFEITGPAQNIGVENGDPLDLASTKLNERKAFNGKCLMILQSKQTAGEVKVKVSSPGLESTEVIFLIEKK